MHLADQRPKQHKEPSRTYLLLEANNITSGKRTKSRATKSQTGTQKTTKKPNKLKHTSGLVRLYTNGNYHYYYYYYYYYYNYRYRYYFIVIVIIIISCSIRRKQQTSRASTNSRFMVTRIKSDQIHNVCSFQLKNGVRETRLLA